MLPQLTYKRKGTLYSPPSLTQGLTSHSSPCHNWNPSGRLSGRSSFGCRSLGSQSSLSQQVSTQLADTIQGPTLVLQLLQSQLTSLALNLLTAERGGTCLFIKEECCYFVNQSGRVEEREPALLQNSVCSSLGPRLLQLLGPLISIFPYFQ